MLFRKPILRGAAANGFCSVNRQYRLQGAAAACVLYAPGFQGAAASSAVYRRLCFLDSPASKSHISLCSLCTTGLKRLRGQCSLGSKGFKELQRLLFSWQRGLQGAAAACNACPRSVISRQHCFQWVSLICVLCVAWDSRSCVACALESPWPSRSCTGLKALCSLCFLDSRQGCKELQRLVLSAKHELQGTAAACAPCLPQSSRSCSGLCSPGRKGLPVPSWHHRLEGTSCRVMGPALALSLSPSLLGAPRRRSPCQSAGIAGAS